MKTLYKSLFILSSFSLATASANAAMVTKYGTDVSFTYDDATLFGSGFVSGNSLFFTPPAFKNQSTNGSNPGVVSDTLNIEIEAYVGTTFTMDAISVTELGDYLLDGPGATVAASIYTAVTSMTSSTPAINTNTVQTGTISSPQDGSTNDWSLTNNNDWAWGNETKLNYTLQNNLTANTNEQGETAFIQKKVVPISIEVMAEVPVPAAAWLFASAIAGLGLTRAKR